MFSLYAALGSVFHHIGSDDVLLQTFLQKKNHREFFCALVCKVIAESDENRYLLDFCTEEHKQLPLHVYILKSLFNIMCKNTVKNFNPSQKASQRKINKLSSN